MTEERIKKFRYSEIFGGHGYLDENGNLIPGTIQGEGKYTGITSLWVRLWGCNKTCDGFGQDDPTNPASYELPYENVDVSKYNSLEDLPVFTKGCDSSASWSKKFMHLAFHETAEDIVKKLRQRLVNGKFRHQLTQQPCHMVFTGGEPILSQHAVLAIMEEFVNKNEVPEFVTIETNGSLPIRDDFKKLFKQLNQTNNTELFWSISPKIFATSGESFESSIKPEIVKQYYDLSPKGQLKFVCNGSKQSWTEIDQAVKLYREAGVPWDVYIMPVGATIDGQKLVDADVADAAIYRGYFVSARVHVYLYKNKWGR